MEDVSEYFKNLLRLHKNNLGKSYKQKSLEDRVNDFNNTRRQTRNTLMFRKRQIDENMTPIKSPESSKPVSLDKNDVKDNVKLPNKRLEMLQKWKLDKEKQKQEKQKTKPAFKYCHVPLEIGLPDLRNVNKEIKGKPIKLHSSHSRSQFAPPNHKFQPPKNIRPIRLSSSNTSFAVKSIVKVSGNSPEIKKHSKVSVDNIISQRTTRALSRLQQSKLKGMENKKINTIGTNNLIEAKDVKNKESNTKIENKSLTFRGTEKNKNVATKNLPTTTLNRDFARKSKNKEVIIKNKAPNKKDKRALKTGKSSSDSMKTCVNDVNIQSDETKNLIKENSKEDNYYQHSSKKSQKLVKNVGWNVIDEVGHVQDKINSTNIHIKTPKSSAKKYKKTPRRNNKTNHLSDEEQMNEDLKRDVSITTKNIEEPKRTFGRNTLKTELGLESNHLDQQKDYDLKFRNSTIGSATGSASPDYPIDNSTEENNSFQSVHTPLKNNIQEDCPVYVSPFVTVSRGKISARNEYHVRHSGSDFTPQHKKISNSTSPKAGADYFFKKLNDEINRIEYICDIWNNYKNSNDIPEEARDMIDVAVGQSKLLISKKFQQFRNLIEQCRKFEYVEKPITCEDLHGFWDLIYMQVVDLDKRFNNLDILKNNGWKEIVPEKRIHTKQGKRKQKKSCASSTLKNIIKAARDTKKSNTEGEPYLLPHTDEVKIFTGGYYSIKSPVIDINETNEQLGGTRKSLRISLLTNQTKSILSSPGLTLMKISQAIKQGDGITPGKSILKNDLTKSIKRITKTVLFKDGLEENISPDLSPRGTGLHYINNVDDKINKENDINESNLITFSPDTSLRRSKRLNKIN